MASNEDDGDAQMMSDDFDEENEKAKPSTSGNNENANNEESDKEDKEDDEKINLEQSFDLSSDEDDDDEENNLLEDIDPDKDFDLLDAELDKNAKYSTDLESKQPNNLENKDGSDEKSKNLSELASKSSVGSTSVAKGQASSGDSSSASTSAAAKAAELKKKAAATENSSKELARKRKLEQMEEENKKMQVLMANFSEEQLNRYEIYRRSAFQKSTVKKIIQTVCGKTVSASVVIAMSGIAKVFVGEMVEKALDVKSKWNEPGPILPKHLREAFRLIKNQNKLSTSVKAKKSTLF